MAMHFLEEGTRGEERVLCREHGKRKGKRDWICLHWRKRKAMPEEVKNPALLRVCSADHRLES